MIWSASIAYTIGLITTDGNLSKDGRHMELTSKDKDQIETFCRILRLKNKIALKSSSYSTQRLYYRVQFGNVRFYKFLMRIGLTPNKSKTLGALNIPKRYLADFLRGHLDGDGSTFSFFDSKYKNSFRLYTVFISGSLNHLRWIQKEILETYGLKGTISEKIRSFELRYAKRSSIKLLNKLYYRKDLPCLERKYSKISRSFDIIHAQAGVEKLEYSLP